MAISVKAVKDKLGSAVRADSIGKNKAGNIIIRRGYFYRHGITVKSFTTQVMDVLGDGYKLVDSGDHFTAFRGGASVANSSHFWVEVAEA